MMRSTERTLITHTGSLPRPPELVEVIEGRDQRELRDDPGFEGKVRKAVTATVHRETAIGVDIVNDGEMGRASFASYITERVTGFDGERQPMPASVESRMYPEFYASHPLNRHAACNAPIKWRGPEHVQRDIADLKAALQGLSPAGVFMSAVAPGQICHNFPNTYYPNHEAYIFAVADAMKNEYREIVDAGFILQLDSPDLALTWNTLEYADKSYKDYRKLVALHIDVLNHALEGIPPDRVRLHVCWGNSERPHVRDVPMEEIVHEVYKARVGAMSFEGANPRHAHEWTVFKDHPLPDGKIIIPGVVDTLTNLVEHPELIAQRIERYANLVGRENVIAGSDCGFSTQVKAKPRLHPSMAWAKLESMAEGAKIATGRLWR